MMTLNSLGTKASVIKILKEVWYTENSDKNSKEFRYIAERN